jgi:hypothetical protein
LTRSEPEMLQNIVQPAQFPRSIARQPARRRMLRSAAFALLGLLVALLAVVAALAWQATRGAISLDLLRGPIESAIRGRLPVNSNVIIGATALSYDSDRGVVLRARDVRLGLPGAATIVVAELSTLTTLGAIARGQADLDAVAISGIEVGVSLPAHLRMENSGGELVRGIVSNFAAQLGMADDLMRGAGLQDVEVQNATLRVVDESGALGPALRISAAHWQPMGAGQSHALLQMDEETGGWEIALERRQDTAGATVTLDIANLPVGALAPDLADANGPYYHSTIALQAQLAVDEVGLFSDLHGTLSTASGTLSVTGRDRIQGARSTVDFDLGASGDRIAIPRGEIRTQTGSVLFEGAADLSEPGGVTLVGRVRGGLLPTARSDHPVAVTGGGAVARIDFSDLALEVQRLQVVTAEGAISAIGQASLAGSSPGVSLAFSLSEMPIAVARALWPPFIASRTRQWIDNNVMSGTVGPATLQVALPPEAMGRRGRGRVLPSYALIGSVPFRETEFLPLPRFPTIRNAQGEIAFANATATVRAQSGVIELPGMGALQAGGTTFAIPELGRPRPWGDLHLELSGPARALAVLSNTAPLSVAADRGIEPGALSGNAQLFLDARIELFGGGMADIKPTFRLALTDFSSTSPIEQRLIGEADLVLEGSPQAFTVKGEGTLDGVQASIDLILGSAGSGQTDVTLLLDDAARERLGLGLAWLIQGPVQASIKNTVTEAQLVVLDLKEARVGLSFLGWEKGPGVPATARFLMERTEQGTHITELTIAGSGFSAEGELSIDPDGELSRLDLAHVALREGDELSATLTANGSGYDASVSGSALDARGIIRSVSAGLGGEVTDLGPIRISIDVDAVTGQNDVVLSDVSGSIVVTSAGLDSVSLAGKANSAESFEWTLGKEGEARILRVFADNGGALIRFAGIYTRITGGNMILDYSGPIGGVGTGVVLLRDFRLLNEPALTSAVETASRGQAFSGLARIQNETSGDLDFSQLRVPFSQQDWVISINDAALRGASLGATAEGIVNIADGRMAITGTFIPAFGINNIAGAIPLLGTILGGGRDEGLVGITYKLFGPIDNPEMMMNPMSAIAPGIFRKIFEYQ